MKDSSSDLEAKKAAARAFALGRSKASSSASAKSDGATRYTKSKTNPKARSHSPDTSPDGSIDTSKNFDLLATVVASASRDSTPVKEGGSAKVTGGAEEVPGATSSASSVHDGARVTATQAGDFSNASTPVSTGPVASAPTDMNEAFDEDEYAKFVRSIISFPVLGPEDDLASLLSRGACAMQTDDEDDGGSYQLSSDEEDLDDDEEELVEIMFGASESDANSGEEIVKSHGGTNSSSSLASPSHTAPARSLNLYSEGANSPIPIDHNLNLSLMAEIEAELSMLLDEDMDAAVTTLLSGHGGTGGGGGASVAKGSTATAAVKGTGGAKAPRTKSLSQPNAKKSTLVQVADKKRVPATRVVAGDAARAASSSRIPPPTPKSKTQLPTSAQIIELRNLMSAHYQLLLQQSVLAVRSANMHRHQKGGRIHGYCDTNAVAALVSAKTGVATSKPETATCRGLDPILEPEDFFFGGESADDLAEILDGAVGMLQDLDENRKDGIRNALQLEVTKRLNPRSRSKQMKSSFAYLSSASLPSEKESSANGKKEKEQNDNTRDAKQGVGPRRLTRSQFQQTLRARDDVGGTTQGQESNQSWTHTNDLPISTSFDVKGLSKLESSFASIDSSVDAVAAQRSYNAAAAARALSRFSEYSIFGPEDNGDACEILLQQAGAHYNKKMIPGRTDPSENLSYPQELLGKNFKPPMSKPLQIQLRKNRAQFTSAEDNLVLRGVNLYGEKEWLLLSDRFLPDRSVSAISQRYSRLCLLIYRAAGVNVDPNGGLDPPPKHPNGSDDFDVDAISKLSPVQPPARFNVHRWSLDEDITLLKAVPLMGYLWAEIGNRLIKHRDRGHLRKRYQVLERRVKACVKREKKMPIELLKEPKSSKSNTKAAGTKRSATKKTSYTRSTSISKQDSAMPASKKSKTASSSAVAVAPKAVATPSRTAVLTQQQQPPPPPPYYGAIYPPPDAYAAYYYYPPAPPVPPAKGVGQKAGEYPHDSYMYHYPYGYYYPPGYTYNGAQLPPGKSHINGKSKEVPVPTATAPPKSNGEARHPGAQFFAQSHSHKKPLAKVSTDSAVCKVAAVSKETTAAPKAATVTAMKETEAPQTPGNIMSAPNVLSQESIGDESATRLGFEGILHDSEWSQMSRVKQMIENGEGSSMRPRDIVSDIERLPSIHASDQDASGLSMLNNVDDPSDVARDTLAGKSNALTGESIMESVLKRANSRSSATQKKASPNAGRKRKTATAAMERQHSLESATLAIHGSPSKSARIHSQLPTTPMSLRGSGELPSIAETPGEIRSLMASLKSPLRGSPTKSPRVGDGALLMKSPGGSLVNMDGFDISNFSTSGEDGLSRLAMTATGSLSQGAFGTTSLMENDLADAISALNALSNPPTPHVSAPNTPQKLPGAPIRRNIASQEDTSENPMSLFALAVGQLNNVKGKSNKSKKG